jgi:hypothetical protein
MNPIEILRRILGVLLLSHAIGSTFGLLQEMYSFQYILALCRVERNHKYVQKFTSSNNLENESRQSLLTLLSC